MSLSLIFSMIGGLGLFLFGMRHLSGNLQKIAGNKIHQILESLSKNPLKGITTGMIITAILQSSGAVSVITIGFVNAGLLTLKQAISIVYGANIGTTITAQIISFDISKFVLPIIGIGFFTTVIAKKKFYQYFGGILIGFGILFLGLSLMSQTLSPLRNYPPFVNLLLNVAAKPVLGIILSAAITAFLHSSSTVTALIISLSIQGLIGLDAAMPLILGTNIGSCFTGLLASFNSTITGKRVAIGHLMFNVTGVIIFYFLLKPFTSLILLTSDTIPRQIANAHTLFNIINSIILLPFIPYVIKTLTRILPGEDKIIKKGTLYLDKNLINTPSLAIGQVTKELIRMGEIGIDMLDNSLSALLQNNERLVQDVYLKEEVLNTVNSEITKYLVLVFQKELSPKQSKELTDLMNISAHFERVGDHIENIADLAETKINDKLPFSQKAVRDLEYIFSKVKKSLQYVIRSLKEHNKELAILVTKREDDIDKLEEGLRDEHIDRLTKQICNPEAGVIYIDILSNLERIADHAYDISLMVIDELTKRSE
ncbi:MAG: Na/Pi cotransporter family protein [Atribacterota bacterium]|nr:Na/Pi cotransporter family protein [Atribacterota bacterium]